MIGISAIIIYISTPFGTDNMQLEISKKPPDAISFHAKAIGYKCFILSDTAKMVPTIQKSLEKFSEGKTKKFVYREESMSTGAIKLYFGWKKSLVQKIPMPDFSQMSTQDWKYAMYFAIHMGDFSFFNDTIGPAFPSLDYMINEMPNLPPEGLIPYVEQYLIEIFYREYNWISEKEQLDALENIKRWIRLYDSEGTQIWMMCMTEIERCATFDNYKSVFEMVLIAVRLVYGEVEPEILIVGEFDTNKLNKANIDLEYYNQIMSQWSDFHVELRRYIVRAWYKFTKVKIGNNFYEDWTNFFTKKPILAELIWTGMDRKELLAITKISHKKYGVASKADFQEMQDYVERFGPKIKSVDLREKQLRKNLESAKQDRFINEDGILIRSKDEIKAESNLKKYIDENKINKKKENDLTQSKIQFNVRMFSLSNKNRSGSG